MHDMSHPLRLHGSRPLSGTLRVQGSKNAALPLIVASLLSPEPVVLRNVPRLSDVETILDLAHHLGARSAWTGPNELTIHTPELISTHAPYALVSRMRASFILLGAVAGRAGEATVSMPGGCAFGYRPVDEHVHALRAIGYDISEDAGHFSARRRSTCGGQHVFSLLTVGGTQNALLAAVLGEGCEVTLENASIDTDVVELARFLRLLGAQIEGEGTHTIHVRGVARLGGGTFDVIGDRIEAGTWLLAAAATRGQVTLEGIEPSRLTALMAKLREMGARTEEGQEWIRIDASGALRPVQVTCGSYPGFPTDLQPQMSAALCTVQGSSTLLDPVYPDRLTHVAELRRMGADIHVASNAQVISGRPLTGTHVRAADLRAGAALIIAALAAQGETTIEGTEYIDRGYDDVTARLRALGAEVSAPALLLAAD